MLASPWSQLLAPAPPPTTWPVERIRRISWLRDADVDLDEPIKRRRCGTNRDQAPADVPAPLVEPPKRSRDRPRGTTRVERCAALDLAILRLIDAGTYGTGQLAREVGLCTASINRICTKLHKAGRLEHLKEGQWLPKGAVQAPKIRRRPPVLCERIALQRQALRDEEDRIAAILACGHATTAEIGRTLGIHRNRVLKATARLAERGLIARINRWELVSPSAT